MLLCVQSKKVSSSFIKILPAVLVVNYLVVTVPKFLLMVIYSSWGGGLSSRCGFCCQDNTL